MNFNFFSLFFIMTNKPYVLIDFSYASKRPFPTYINMHFNKVPLSKVTLQLIVWCKKKKRPLVIKGPNTYPLYRYPLVFDLYKSLVIGGGFCCTTWNNYVEYFSIQEGGCAFHA